MWGRNALVAIFLAAFAVSSVSADAGPAKDKASSKSTKKLHAKLDRELNKLADGVGDSDVIVEFTDDSDSGAITARRRPAGPQARQHQGSRRAHQQALLKRLAENPKVKDHKDRAARAIIGRTAVTVGARDVHAQYG